METLDQPEILEKKPGRTFLITLAVLTFANAGTRIFLSVALFIVISELTKMYGGNVPERNWMVMLAYSLLFSALLSISGAILMLLRKKPGIWIYCTGQLLILIGVFAFSSLLVRNGMHDFTPFIILAMIILPLLNTTLYFLAVRKRAALNTNTNNL